MESMQCTKCHENHQYFKKAMFWAVIIMGGTITATFVKLISNGYTDAVVRAVKEQGEAIERLSEGFEDYRKNTDYLTYFALINWDKYHEFVVRQHMSTPESVQGTPEQHAQVIRMMLEPGQREEMINRIGADFV